MEPIGKLAKSTAHDKLNQPLFREAPMSLELAAQHLASRGRKGDTMLVHMAPQEVSGLQALARAHGGTLTVNPDTGLPEANFLKRLLPTLIGAGLMFATGGTAAPLIGGLSNSALIGLGVGGLETARTGNLGKGLMAGLGAYGGAGLLGGLMGAGAAEAGKTAVTSATGEAAKQGLTGEAYNQAVQNSVTNQMAGLSNFDKLSTGFSNPATAVNAMGGGMGVAKYGLAAMNPMMQAGEEKPFDGGGPNPYEYDYDPNKQFYTRVPLGTRQRDILAPTTPMMAMGGPVEDMSYQNRMDTMMANGGQMFATGGQINLQGTFDVGGGQGGSQMGSSNNLKPFVGSNNASSMTQPAVMPQDLMFRGTPEPAVMPQDLMFRGTPEPAVMPRGFQERSKGLMSQGIAFAEGGISHLGDYSDGGRLLKGPGDGVSDSIPAMIANKRPARLADGEFVVPARIVSELGNGSTEAGARKLYAMMARVQKARGKTTGKNRVAVNSRTEKLLPA
jgi:hypothetical protein